MSRIFLQNGWEKPLIIWICNRFDYFDSVHPDREYYDLFKKGTQQPNVRIISYTAYEHIYAAKKGIDVGTFTIKPIGKCEDHFRYSNQSAIPSTIDKQHTIFVHPRITGISVEKLKKILSDNEIPFYYGTYNGPFDLKGFKGILTFPYAWSTLALFENIQNGLVQFVPSAKFMQELLQQGWGLHSSIAADLKSHYFNVSELYTEENKSAIVYFDSWQDLKEKINSLDYTSMTKNILELAQQHRSTMLNRWHDVFDSFCAHTKTTSTSTLILEKYKSFLEKGTYEGQDWSHFTVPPQSRYYTFKKAFDMFEKAQGHTIVELGTTRSFVHGGHTGCNKDNPADWDWGAGSFTRMACECLYHLNPVIHTVDLEGRHIARCKIITQDFKDIMNYHVSSSEDFLHTIPEPLSIDLLYMDTGDMTPIERTAQLHLREARIVVERNLIAPGGIILIDDVRNQTPKKFGENSDHGKAKYSIPFFLEHGFEMIADEYQVILHKKL